MALPPSHDNWFDFGVTNESFAANITQSIWDNDTNTLQHLLETFKNVSLPLPFWLQAQQTLHLAASQDRFKECLEVLLKYSDSKLFDTNKEWMSRTVLDTACMHGCEENALILLRNGCNPSKLKLLLIAAEKGFSKIVEYLLNYYPDSINEGDYFGRTPLHTALSYNHPKIVLMLLQRGANVLSIDHQGRLPLHFACHLDFDIMLLLVKHDLTSVNHQDFEGITPIMLAIERCRGTSLQSVRFLLESGAKTDICDQEGRMALHYATRSGNPQLLQYVLEHTETSSIEKWFRNIPNVLGANKKIHSLIGCAIRSRSMECLEMLLSSDKLSKHILQTPFVDYREIFSPVALIFHNMHYQKKEKLISYLELLSKHDVIMLDEFFSETEIEWQCDKIEFSHPFTEVFHPDRSFSDLQDYFYRVNENNITIDYCLQCYHDNTKPFATFTDYNNYYKPVMEVILDNQIEPLKLLMSNSNILEPDELLIQFNAENEINLRFDRQRYRSLVYYESNSIKMRGLRENIARENIYRYLIWLKPIYYRLDQLCNKAGSNELSWYPYSTASEEFSTCTLQQLCRTTIRQHIRKYNLKDNLRDFRRHILQLPLPTLLKDYLLFK